MSAADVALLDRHVALGLGLGGIVLAATVWRRHPVDGRQKAEIVEADHIAQCDSGLAPRVGSHTYPHVVAGLDERIEQRLAEFAAQLIDRALAQSVAGEFGNRSVS